ATVQDKAVCQFGDGDHPIEELAGGGGRVDQLVGGAPAGHQSLLEQADAVEVVADLVVRVAQGLAGDGPFGVVELPAFGGPDEGAGAVVGVVVEAGFGQGGGDRDGRAGGAEAATEGDANERS